MPDKNNKAEERSCKAEIEKLTSELEEAVSARRKAEDALSDSKNMYRSITELSTDVFFTLDTNGLFTYISPSVEALTGFSLKRFIGHSFTEIVVPEYIETAVNNFKRGLSGEEIPLYEIEILHKDGGTIHVELNGSTLFDDNGKVIGRVVIGRDITRRKQAQEALRESEQFLSDVFESVQDGISVLKPDLTIVHVNKTINEWYKENIPVEGKKCFEVYRNADKPCDPCPTLRCLESCRKESNIVPGLPGSPVEWLELFSYPIKDPNSDEITGVVEFARDITDRKKAGNALKESEARLNIIFKAAPDAYYINDFTGTFIDGNSAAETLLGYPKEELIGKTFIGAGILSAEGAEKAIGILAENIKGNSTGPDSFTLRRKDGTEVKVEILTHPVKIAGEDRVLGIARDITEQDKLEEQLRHAHKMESVGRLAGGVAHDFNNMLSVILGNTEMALDKIDPDQALYTLLTEIHSAAGRSADLTKQLLAFARRQTITPQILDINETVEGMLRMLRRLIGENIDLDWIPGADVWPIKVDPSQIDQIMANLCVNARDAIDGVGKVIIKTDHITLDEADSAGYPESTPGEYTLLTMSDNGCGIDKKTMDVLFEPFFTTKDTGKGTGLGLAMVYGIVKQNGGFINVISEPGQGTTFNIYLPRHKDRGDGAQKESSSEQLRFGCETILLVEDEPSILKLLTMMLENQGYIVIPASSPGEAIRLAGEHTGKINLLVTDVVMPEMNGRDLAGNLLSIYPDIKRLFMSGYTANVIAHHGVLDEGVHFIQKPFTNQEMAAIVREALDSE